jgi:hypothetical protein
MQVCEIISSPTHTSPASRNEHGILAAILSILLYGVWHIPHGPYPAARASAELEKVTRFAADIFLAALQLG